MFSTLQTIEELKRRLDERFQQIKLKYGYIHLTYTEHDKDTINNLRKSRDLI